jgi:hypothetical protein
MPKPPRPNPSDARLVIGGGAADDVAEPGPPRAPSRASANTKAFWVLMDRWGVPDLAALDLIGFPGKPDRMGKRPRFRLTTKQTEILGFLLQIDRAAQFAGTNAGLWLHRSQRAAPMAGRTPLQAMTEDRTAAMTAILHFPTRSAMQRALRGGMGK